MKPSSTWKNLSFALSGNFGAQIISLAFYPLLVRIFAPDDFGVFGTYISFMVIGSIFASGQFHLAFIKCEEDEELNHVYGLFQIYSLIGTLVVTLIASAINYYFKYFPNSYMLLLPISIFSYLSFESRKMLTVRDEKFKVMSQAVGLNRFVSNLSKVLLGKISASPIILITSEIFTNISSAFLIRNKASVNPKRTKLGEVLKKYKQFPLFASFSNFFQLGLSEFPVLLLAVNYAPAQIGPYVLTMRLLLQPLAVIGNSLGGVISKRIVKAHNLKTETRKLVGKIYLGYILLGATIFTVVWLMPTDWFTFVLGEKWIGFKDVLLPMTILSAAKLSSGLHIYFYVATDGMRIKSFWKAAQLLSVSLTILCFSYMPFIKLLWFACMVEAVIDLLFVFYTIKFRTISSSQIPGNSTPN